MPDMPTPPALREALLGLCESPTAGQEEVLNHWLLNCKSLTSILLTLYIDNNDNHPEQWPLTAHPRLADVAAVAGALGLPVQYMIGWVDKSKNTYEEGFTIQEQGERHPRVMVRPEHFAYPGMTKVVLLELLTEAAKAEMRLLTASAAKAASNG